MRVARWRTPKREPSPERVDDLLLEPGGVDDDLAHAAARQRLEVPLDQRLAVHLAAAAWGSGRSAAACARRGRRPGSIAFMSVAVAAVERVALDPAPARTRPPARPSAPRRLGRVVGAEVADVDVERRRLELGPGVHGEVRLGQQHRRRSRRPAPSAPWPGEAVEQLADRRAGRRAATAAEAARRAGCAARSRRPRSAAQPRRSAVRCRPCMGATYPAAVKWPAHLPQDAP